MTIPLLVSQMMCHNCATLLHLKDFYGEERRYGLASEIPLRCAGCLGVTYVYTSNDSTTKNFEKDRRSRVFDANSKLAMGI